MWTVLQRDYTLVQTDPIHPNLQSYYIRFQYNNASGCNCINKGNCFSSTVWKAISSVDSSKSWPSFLQIACLPMNSQHRTQCMQAVWCNELWCSANNHLSFWAPMQLIAYVKNYSAAWWWWAVDRDKVNYNFTRLMTTFKLYNYVASQRGSSVMPIRHTQREIGSSNVTW